MQIRNLANMKGTHASGSTRIKQQEETFVSIGIGE